jgi:choline-sulfatase
MTHSVPAAGRGVVESYRADLGERFATAPTLVRPSTLPLDLYYDSYVGRSGRAHLATLERGAPWFCWVSFGGPHDPWDAPESYASMYAPETMPAPRPRSLSDTRGLLRERYGSRDLSPELSAREVAAMRANYAGNVTLIDHEIGQIIETVRRRGELDSTLIVFTSDHGEMNGDYGLVYKQNFLDPAIKVPLIVVAPGAQGGTSSALVELMDIGATMTEYAGARLPGPSQARSLRALIEGRAPSHRDFAVSEFAGHGCVIGSRLKVEFDPQMNATLAIDRIEDSDERTDVSREPGYQTEIAALARWLGEFRSAAPPRSVTLENLRLPS